MGITVNALVPAILLNGSFEAGLSNWNPTGNLAVQSSASYAATDGSSLVVFNGGQTTPNGVLSQTFATMAGQSYTLTFDMGVLAYNTNPQTLQVTVTGTGILLSQTITIKGLGGGAVRWQPQTFTLVANSATTTLSFRDQSTSTTNLDLLLDHVEIVGKATAPNTPPVAVADSYATFQDTVLTVPAAGVLANDTDAQANPLTAVLNAGPSHGNLTLNANGGFTYTPSAGYTGNDSFSYHANDGTMDSTVATVGMSVNANVAVTLVNGSFESNYTGWTTSGNQSIKSSAPYAPTDGSSLVAFNDGQSTPNAVLSQAFATALGQTYTLTFDAGVLAYNKNQQILLVTVTGVGVVLSQTITLTGLGGGAIAWAPQTFTFVANSAVSTLTFRDQSPTTKDIDLLLDHVRVAGPAPVQAISPEPATIGEPSLAGTPGGGFTIGLTTKQPGTYVLERSQDLQTWKSVSTMQVLQSGPIEFHDDPIPPGTGPTPDKLFYRIGLQLDAPAN